METNYKAIAVIGSIVVALFAGGLYLVIQENNNRRVAYDLVQKYLATDEPAQMVALEGQIRNLTEKRPIAMTSRASTDTFEELVANGKACEGYTEQALFNPRETQRNYQEIWLYCMDHPEVLKK